MYKKYFKINSIILIFLLIASFQAYSAYGYTITLKPLTQSVELNQMLGNGYFRAQGTNYAEYSGIYYDSTCGVGHAVRAGSSVMSGTSKLYAGGSIISNAFIEFSIWSYIDTAHIFETWHAYHGLFLLNIQSDVNDAGPISIHSYARNGSGHTKIYDSSYNLVSEIGDPYINYTFLPGENYYLNLMMFYDTMTELNCSKEEQFRLAFSLVEAAPVPEPSTFLLLGAGLVGLATYRIKKSRK